MDDQPYDENDLQNPAAGDVRLVDEDAPADMLLLDRYANWPDKGKVVDGRRVTILAEKRAYEPGEVVGVSHILEAVVPGHELYIMGPKPIYDEYVNDRRFGQPPPAGDVDPFTPQEYDGRVVSSPGIDANFVTRQYRFSKPGRYEICWRPGRWRSNTLVIDVR